MMFVVADAVQLRVRLRLPGVTIRLVGGFVRSGVPVPCTQLEVPALFLARSLTRYSLPLTRFVTPQPVSVPDGWLDAATQAVPASFGSELVDAAESATACVVAEVK